MQNYWESLEDSAHISGNNVQVSAEISDKMISSASHAIFVYRSTFSRILALFKNKFIQGTGAADIQRNFHSVTGIYPNDVSFFDFVNIYLTKSFQDLDPHTFPQRCHLLPIQYSDAIPIEFLQNRMSAIVGNKRSSRYFSSPTNSTGNKTIQTAECLAHAPVSVIKKRHCVNGLLPGNDAFRDPAIKNLLREIYHEDEVLFRDPQSK